MLIDVVSYYLLGTVLFILFLYPKHLHDSIIVWSHDICTCTLPLFYTLIGSSDSRNFHIQIYEYFF